MVVAIRWIIFIEIYIVLYMQPFCEFAQNALTNIEKGDIIKAQSCNML